jgi:hypothetical protein
LPRSDNRFEIVREQSRLSACYRACGYAGRDEPRLERCREVLRPPLVRLASQGVRNGICARGQESPRLGVTQGRRAIQSEARPSAARSDRGLFCFQASDWVVVKSQSGLICMRRIFLGWRLPSARCPLYPESLPPAFPLRSGGLPSGVSSCLPSGCPAASLSLRLSL